MSDPVSWLVIEKGWAVVAADGSEIGQVDELIGDRNRDIFDGIAVATSLVGKPRYLPAERVARIFEGRVETDLGPADVEQLEGHDPAPPSEQFLAD